MKCPRSFRPWFAVAILLWFAGAAHAEARHEIAFPDLPGYKTLKCDFHMHTVFSDGQVWPTVRVEEAWRTGLDAIAITDHIEYQPHKTDLPTNRNRPYELAADAAKACNILVIKGAEITRDTPPGHYNALFLSDVNALVKEDFVDAVGEANKQGAFVFWNHHEWHGEEKGRWTNLQTKLLEKKWLHGMEVANEPEYYPRAHQWCLDRNLTMFGDTDMHEPDLRKQTTSDDHRTMTLVFAKERTVESIKEALLARRTAVWTEKTLIGREEWLTPLFKQCVRVKSVNLRTGNQVWVAIENTCAMDIQFERVGAIGPMKATLPAQSVSLVEIPTDKPNATIELSYIATNWLIAPDKGLPVKIRVPGEETPKE